MIKGVIWESDDWAVTDNGYIFYKDNKTAPVQGEYIRWIYDGVLTKIKLMYDTFKHVFKHNLTHKEVFLTLLTKICTSICY